MTLPPDGILIGGFRPFCTAHSRDTDTDRHATYYISGNSPHSQQVGCRQLQSCTLLQLKSLAPLSGTPAPDNQNILNALRTSTHPRHAADRQTQYDYRDKQRQQIRGLQIDVMKALRIPPPLWSGWYHPQYITDLLVGYI